MSAGAGAAAAAAAEEQRRMRVEEEEMTPYSSSDLAQDWEFKIIRSAMASFRKPEYLRRVLDNEARAGWVLVEKFDSHRIRLKRSALARERDGKLDFDPYRTDVGPSQGIIAFMVVAGLAAAALLMMVVMSNLR
jgi:hypothetical protein